MDKVIGYATANEKYNVSFFNDLGGIESMPLGRYKVEIIEFDDILNQILPLLYGVLLEDNDIETARYIGTTGETTKDYEGIKYSLPIWYDQIQQSQKNFLNPPIVRFRSDSFEEINSNE